MLELLFTNTKINSAVANRPPQVNHDITCCNKYEVYEGGEAEQHENWGGVNRDSKDRRDGGEDQGGKKQDDEEGSEREE